MLQYDMGCAAMNDGESEMRFASGRILRSWSVVLMILLGIAAAAHAQPIDLMRQIAGSWFLADESLTFPNGRTIKSWGKEPYGYLGFDGDSHFSMMMIRSDLPKFETRGSGTLQQNDAIAKGMIAYYGSYAAGDDGTSIVVHIIGSTFTAFNDTVSRRPLEFRGPDEFVMHVLVPNSGVKTELVWRRAGK